jgi:hypothetical protein
MRIEEAGNGSAGRRRDRWAAGVAAGLLAAVAMMAFMAAVAAVDGSPLDPLRAVGTSFRGSDPSTAGPLPVLWGIVLHLAAGAAFGVAFMAVAPRATTAAAGTVLGAGYAIVVMALVLPFIVPAVAPGLHARMSAHGGAWVIAHALFGAVAGLGPAIRRRMAERPGRKAPEAGPGVLRPRTSP